MIFYQLLFLIGLFGLPMWLLWVGHGLRHRSVVQRGLFWGGTIGYGLGMLVMIGAMHYPPVLWAGARMPLVYASTFVITLIGAGVGGLRAKAAAR